ncbi:MAG: Xylulose kinase [uncultured Solirubrobacteraceae bacterium]|uniref:Xylulose kinase n=1 Tax=uncultured Solirubrobacteraceae bacterium TaxID=1162706 RepID=A0A6J4S3H3_9ACTN|nr:MAG: Xylulose kinase [uncultured Solirubrobacteraceae bacterium]
MHALCVDVGTSLIKSVAYDATGRELAVERRPTRVSRPAPGRAEQDMAEVWEAVAETIRSVRDGLGQDPALLALTAQGDGCWLVDGAGDPVGPAILWSDGRAASIVERWAADGRIEQAFRANGSLTFPGLSNAILTWLREHEPDRLARAEQALHSGGWVFHQLTGELVVDESDASAPLLDLRSRTYSDALLELFDLQWARRLLPEPVPAGRHVGSLTPAAARGLGLPAGLPVVLAPYDIAATAIGAGATSPGQACCILGTTLCTELVTDVLDTDATPSGFTIAMGPGRHLRAYPSLSGTEVLTWAARMLAVAGPPEVTQLAACGGDLSRDAPFLLPYLSPAGERAPFLDPDARGMLIGLTYEHRPEQLALSVLEGLSHVVRECLEGGSAGAQELRLCGGGANSAFWSQLIADVTGVPTLRSADSETGAKGALICARVALGDYADLATAAAALVEPRDAFAPRPAHADLHDERFRQFIELRRLAEPAWRQLHAGREQRSRSPAGGVRG